MAGPIIAQKLESLRRCVARIEARCPDSSTKLSTDVDAQDIVSLNLTRAVQWCVDVAAHWLAGQPDWSAPRTMGETFRILGQAGKLNEALALRLRKTVGFRNIVIHNYEAIDWQIVFHLCTDRLVDFRDFARAFADD